MDSEKYTRRSILKMGCFGGTSFLLTGCAVTEAFKSDLQLSIAQANVKQMSPRTRQSLEREALRRYNMAVSLSTPHFGMPPDSFERAYQLLEQNFSALVRTINKDLWMQSKMYWVFTLSDEDAEKISQNASTLRLALKDIVSESYEFSLRPAKVKLAIAGMLLGFLSDNLNEAQKWFDYASDSLDVGFRSSTNMEGLVKLDLIRYLKLSSILALKKGDLRLSMKFLISQQLLSVNAPENSRNFSSISDQALERYCSSMLASDSDIIVSVIDIRVESYFLFCRKVSGQLFFESEAILRKNGSKVSSSTFEHFLYNTSFRRSFVGTGLSGYIGLYSASDNGGTLSQSETFYNDIPKYVLSLWDSFGDPLTRYLDTRNINDSNTVHLLLPDSLSYLPILAATDPKSKTTLVESASFIQASITPLKTTKARHKRKYKAMSFHNMAGDLAASRLEEDVVMSMFSGERSLKKLDPNISVNKFLSQVEQANPELLYISTHGASISMKANESGLLLGNGKLLSIEDIARSRIRISTELVVLSACEVGAVMPAGLHKRTMNIATSFLGLGAKNVVCALWRVETVSTALLLSRFSLNVFSEGMTASRALTSAQLWLQNASKEDISDFIYDLAGQGIVSAASLAQFTHLLDTGDRSTKPYKSPYYWGGFKCFESVSSDVSSAAFSL